MTDRPRPTDEQPGDVLADLLSSLRLSTLVYGRLELGAPWGFGMGDQPDAAALYVVVRGGARLEVGSEPAVVLDAGDVALLPSGGAHTLRDGKDSPLHVLGEGDCHASGGVIRLGGDGARTTILAGAFLPGSHIRATLLTRLPRVIHITASDPEVAPWLPSTVQLIVAESSARGPGSSVVMSRLADVLLVQALRTFIRDSSCPERGLRALGDTQVGKALELIHQRVAERWTVERLARSVGLSRSGFAARFTDLVGEPPLEYVARWRMLRAAELLAETPLSLGDVAERVGYRSEAAFNRAFKRLEGTAPATYRRQRREGVRQAG